MKKECHKISVWITGSLAKVVIPIFFNIFIRSNIRKGQRSFTAKDRQASTPRTGRLPQKIDATVTLGAAFTRKVNFVVERFLL